MKLPFTKSALDAKQASCVKLAQHLTDAKAALAKQESTVARLAEDGVSDKELKTALDAKRDAEDLVKTRSKAHSDAIAEVAALEAEEVRLAKEKECNEAGDKAEDIARVADKDIDEWILLTRRCAVSSGRERDEVNPFDYGMAELFAKLAIEVPVSVKMKRSETKLRVAAVRTGQAVLAQPAPAPVPLPPPAPVTQVCVLKAIAWLDAANVVQTAARGADISLPPKTAQRAIEIGACCAMSDARRRMVKENPGRLGKPLFRNCVQLSDGMVDNEPEPFAPEPVMRSAPVNTPDPRFEIVPRGPPRQMQVEGARSLDDVARSNREGDKK